MMDKKLKLIDKLKARYPKLENDPLMDDLEMMIHEPIDMEDDEEIMPEEDFDMMDDEELDEEDMEEDEEGFEDWVLSVFD